MPLQIDESEWPLVVVRWEGELTDGEVDGILAAMGRWLTREERFGLLLDSRGGGGLSPEQRTNVIAYMKREAERTALWLVQAMVIDNLIQRTVFYGINLVFPNRFSSKVFADPQSARAWLRSNLERSE